MTIFTALGRPFANLRERRQRVRRAARLRAHRIPFRQWRDARARLPALAGLPPRQRRRLRALAGDFIASKAIVGVRGQEVDAAMRTAIAAQACQLVLELGLAVYDGWQTVLVYPDTFLVEREEMDEAGVLHSSREELAGESWDRGPVVLSWGDICGPGDELDGAIIIHEFAHKLDMLSGGANGMPPLHRDMAGADWTRAFSDAYARLCDAVDAGEETAIDPYAAETPGEFFAVTSELFFIAPAELRSLFPAVYGQLRAFYRQDPAAAASAC